MRITFNSDGSAAVKRGEPLYLGSDGVNKVIIGWTSPPATQGLIVQVNITRRDGQASGFAPCTRNTQSQTLEYYYPITGWDLSVEGELFIVARWYNTGTAGTQATKEVKAYVERGKIIGIAAPESGFDVYANQVLALQSEIGKARSDLAGLIQDENARAEGAEVKIRSDLTLAIQKEQTRAEGAENNLDVKIIAETQRATAAESGLSQRIDEQEKLNTSIENAVPNTRKINGKQLISDIVLNASDVGAATSDQGATADEAFLTAHDARSIALGRSNAFVFETESEMRAWITVPANIAKLTIGSNLYIIDIGVPDYWWTGKKAVPLETEKVDLSEYYTKTQIDFLLSHKIGTGEFNLVTGALQGEVSALRIEISQAINSFEYQLSAVNNLINPLTGQRDTLQEILNSLAGVRAQPITYASLAALKLTYAQIAALKATYYDIKYKGKLIFGGI